MSEGKQRPKEAKIVIKIAPEILQNKTKKTEKIKTTSTAVCALLNSRDGGIVTLPSPSSLTPTVLDELVRGIEQTLIEFLGLTSFREYCKTEIKDLGKEINLAVSPSDRICTIEYNLVLPTDFLVKQVLRTEPLEKIAPLLRSKPLDNSKLHHHEQEFKKDSIMPKDRRESDTVQFKKIKSDKNKNKTLADRIIANKIAHYIVAFANHKGGHVYIGIDDEMYQICGQTVDEKEKKRIQEKIGSAIANIVWPEEHGKPQLGKHWDISFVPVLDAKDEIIPELYVIVVAIAFCPGGVFLTYPEAYEISDDQKVQKMEYGRWKKRLLHDAQMRDIVKFCRENSWKNESEHQVENSEGKDLKTSQNVDLNDTDNSTGASTSEHVSIPVTMPPITTPNSTSRTLCRRITDFMEQLIQDGNFEDLQRFASKVEMCKSFHGADIEVLVRFMLALGAYRRRNFNGAYEELTKASSLIASTKNSTEFDIQRLHLLACFQRGEGDYDKSYKVTYGGLQEMERISPGWHTAWMLNDAGYLFNVLAGDERNPEVRKSLKQQALSLYTKAIAHTQAIKCKGTETDEKFLFLKSNLLHRCHL